MKMKNIFHLVIVVAIFLTGCERLEIKPTGLVEPEEAIKNEQDVKDLLNGTYTVLRDDGFMGGGVQITSELMGDFVNGNALTGDYLNIFNFNSIGLGTTVTQYTKPYTVIQRANHTLENLSLVTSSDASRNNVEGQARFMRAFSYFEMVRLFAQPWGYTADNSHLGLVIKTSSELETALPRSTVANVYALILSDLTSAASLLPATNGNYPTSWSAKAILARVYFQMNKFDSAYKYADQVIASSQFAFDNSATFVTNRFSSPQTTESIFWIVNEPTLPAAFTRLRNTGNLDQSMGLTITQAAYENGVINPNDLRKAWYKDSITTSGAHIYSINKYKHPSFVLPVIHLTELKLIRAESAAELDQNLATAIADINDITNRAYAGTLAPLGGGASAATIKARVRSERILEMAFESGDRLQQIKRIGAKGETSMSRTAPWNCLGMALQFPATETNVNSNFIQNPIGTCL
jgi:starch-binding outer membrane protein, SusD/RagB family